MQIAPVPNTPWGSVTITHPFHPLQGQTYPVLQVRRVNDVRLYSLDTPQGVRAVPEAWTDRRPPGKMPDTPWSPAVIRDWRQLSTIMEQSSHKG